MRVMQMFRKIIGLAVVGSAFLSADESRPTRVLIIPRDYLFSVDMKLSNEKGHRQTVTRRIPVKTQGPTDLHNKLSQFQRYAPDSNGGAVEVFKETVVTTTADFLVTFRFQPRTEQGMNSASQLKMFEHDYSFNALDKEQGLSIITKMKNGYLKKWNELSENNLVEVRFQKMQIENGSVSGGVTFVDSSSSQLSFPKLNQIEQTGLLEKISAKADMVKISRHEMPEPQFNGNIGLQPFSVSIWMDPNTEYVFKGAVSFWRSEGVASSVKRIGDFIDGLEGTVREAKSLERRIILTKDAFGVRALSIASPESP